jgi:hypothetical protein
MACVEELFETRLASGDPDRIDSDIKATIDIFLYGVSANVGHRKDEA